MPNKVSRSRKTQAKQANIVTTAQVRHITRAIEDAFASLRQQDIFCKSDYKCCTTCAFHAMDSEEQGTDSAPVGYAFYHMQDADRLDECGELILRYGLWDEAAVDGDRDAAQADIGQMVAAAMMLAGLAVNWDGSPHTCIAVTLGDHWEECVGTSRQGLRELYALKQQMWEQNRESA